MIFLLGLLPTCSSFGLLHIPGWGLLPGQCGAECGTASLISLQFIPQASQTSSRSECNAHFSHP